MANSFAAVSGIVAKIKKSFEMRQYNRYTIAEYFRKQGAHVGNSCMIIPTRLGTEPYLVTIGDHVAIAEGVTFITHDGGPWIFRHEIPDIQVFGPIVIEDNCLIGQNAVLFPNIRIGRNSIVGAGSVVIADVPADSIVMGVPARAFGSVVKYKEKCVERWKQQKPAGCFVEPEKNWWNSERFGENREILKKHLINLFQKDNAH
jgi:acetyltransferase-like isoleucine patch superfamily enzyme